MSPEQNDPAVRQATDPTLARTVIEERDGYPAHLSQSEGEGDRGLLRVGFRDRDEDLEEISWEQFSDEFTEKNLAAVYRTDEGDVDDNRPVVLRDRDEVDVEEA